MFPNSKSNLHHSDCSSMSFEPLLQISARPDYGQLELELWWNLDAEKKIVFSLFSKSGWTPIFSIFLYLYSPSGLKPEWALGYNIRPQTWAFLLIRRDTREIHLDKDVRWRCVLGHDPVCQERTSVRRAKY